MLQFVFYWWVLGRRYHSEQPLCPGCPREPPPVAPAALPVRALPRHGPLRQREEISRHVNQPQGQNQQPHLQRHRHRRRPHAAGRLAGPRRVLPLQPEAQRGGLPGRESASGSGPAAERHSGLSGKKPAQTRPAVLGAGGRALSRQQNQGLDAWEGLGNEADMVLRRTTEQVQLYS